jgi:tetratricopeptide (TPR) repeat protein
VALHLEQAGGAAEARAHGLAAAEFAGSVGAVKERAEALELVRRVSGPYDGRVAAALATCHLGLRQFDKVDALCEEARAQPNLPEALKAEFRYIQIAADHYCGRAPLSRICAELEELLGSRGPGAFASRGDAMTLLLRTADKTCDIGLVRATARAQWRSERGSADAGPSAHALFARAYVFAKYYWPERAYPLLKEAQRKAEKEQNWELDHACREGLGVVLKQVGRFAESIEQFQFSLALGKRTLNPQAQVASLINLAVVEEARGEYESATSYLQEAEELDSQYPHWYHRVYRVANQAELALETGNPEQAAVKYREALRHALEMDERRIAMAACAGLALCAKEQGDARGLAAWCAELRSVAACRERALHDRWYVEAAYAWNSCLNEADPNAAVERLESTLRELRRRDIDHWLRLELEAVRVQEYLSGQVSEQRRAQLVEFARFYSAHGIIQQAVPGLLGNGPG